MFVKKNKLFKKYKTKELKTKDGYNRFEFMGRIFSYKEDEIRITEHDFSGTSLEHGETRAFDREGNQYIVEFLFRNKWIPISITLMSASYY